MPRDNTKQHVADMGDKVVDVGSKAFVTTATTLTLDTPLSVIESVSFASDTAATSLGSIIISTPSISSGNTYVVTGGSVVVTRSNNASGAVLFYTLTGY